jgi:hypothetical protein
MLRIVFFKSRRVKNESIHDDDDDDDDHSATENVQQILLISECIIFNILRSR